MGDLIDFSARRDARKTSALSSAPRPDGLAEPAKRHPDREPARGSAPNPSQRQAAVQFASDAGETYAEEYEAFSAEEDYQSEVLQELAEELEEAREDWARSEEDGWFYED